MASRQLNIRLSDDQREVLDALAFVEGLSPTDMARQVLAVRLEAAESDELVIRARRIRAEAIARSEGTLRTLSEHTFEDSA